MSQESREPPRHRVAVLGTIHLNHLRPMGYSFADLARAIEVFRPRVVCAEMGAAEYGTKEEVFFPPVDALLDSESDRLRIEHVPVGRPYRQSQSSERRKLRSVVDGLIDERSVQSPSSRDLYQWVHRDDVQSQLRDRLSRALGAGEAEWRAQHRVEIESCLERAKTWSGSAPVLFVFGLQHRPILEELLRARDDVELVPAPSIGSSRVVEVSDGVLQSWRRMLSTSRSVLTSGFYSKQEKEAFRRSGRIAALERLLATKGKPMKSDGPER